MQLWTWDPRCNPNACGILQYIVLGHPARVRTAYCNTQYPGIRMVHTCNSHDINHYENHTTMNHHEKMWIVTIHISSHYTAAISTYNTL